MPDVLLTFHCAESDVEALVDAIREAVRAPIHTRDEAVFGRDFDDADTAERVMGTLRRAAVELVVEEAQVAEIVAAVDGSRRRLPVRWQTVAVLGRGRLA